MGNELVSSILSYALSVFMGAAVVAASVYCSLKVIRAKCT